MKIGDLIKELRKEKKLTQADLAKKLGIAPTSVSAWERHENRPLIDKIVMMSEIFEVPMTRFFEDVVKEESGSYSTEQEQDAHLLNNIKRIARKHDMDLTDPKTLELVDSALDFIMRMKKE